jgi:hypothetical protein
MTISFAKKDLRVILPTIVVGILFVPAVARSQFGIPGIPQIVLDPTAVTSLGHIWEQDISTYAKVLEELKQMTNIYNQAVRSYDFSVAMAQRFSNKPWRSLGRGIVNTRTPNRFGETVNWDGALNTGLRADVAWSSGTFPLSGDMSFVQGTDQARTLGHIEMADSAGESTLATLGTCSSLSVQNEPIITDLEKTVLDSTDNTNTFAKQANLTNAALAQQTRLQQCSQAIQYEQTKQILVANLRSRDADAALLNTYSDAVIASTARPSGLAGMENTLFDEEIQ